LDPLQRLKSLKRGGAETRSKIGRFWPWLMMTLPERNWPTSDRIFLRASASPR